MSKGVKITNDAVALEAGRSKGSIKKSRPVFAGLIQAIAAAAAAQTRPKHEHNERVNRAKIVATQYRRELEASLASPTFSTHLKKRIIWGARLVQALVSTRHSVRKSL